MSVSSMILRNGCVALSDLRVDGPNKGGCWGMVGHLRVKTPALSL